MFFRKRLKCSNLKSSSPYNKVLNSSDIQSKIRILEPKNIVFIDSIIYKDFNKKTLVNMQDNCEIEKYEINEMDIVNTYEILDSKGVKFIMNTINPTEFFQSEYLFSFYKK